MAVRRSAVATADEWYENQGKATSYFTLRYHGEDAVVNLRTPRIQLEQRYHIPELAGRLKATTKETMDRLAAPRLMELESYKKERELPLTVGDQVCTFYDNYFGVVEQVVNGRVKVFVSGQAMAETGFHFRSRGGYFQSKDMNEYRWFAEDEVGPCSVN